MEVTELITRLIEQLREQIEVREIVIKALASGFVFLATVIGSFFFIYRKDKRKSDERFYIMHNDLIRAVNNNTESNIIIRNAIDNNNTIIKEFPAIMKDTIITTIKLAMK